MKMKNKIAALAASAALFVSGGITFNMLDVSFPEKESISAEEFEAFELTRDKGSGNYYDKQGLTYTLNSDRRTASVYSSYSLHNNIYAVTIPAVVSYNDTLYDVTYIEDDAFTNNTTIRAVSFEGFENTRFRFGIGYTRDYSVGAFQGCTALESVQLPSSLGYIGACTFDGCTKLKSIEIPEGTSTISANAFKNCDALTEVTIPASVINGISADCFNNCNKLAHVTVKEAEDENGLKYGASKIESAAFADCPALLTVTIPECVAAISEDAFKNSGGGSGFTIYGVSGSTAEEFASTNPSCGFEPIDKLENIDMILKGDMDNNGRLTSEDALIILQTIVGL